MNESGSLSIVESKRRTFLETTSNSINWYLVETFPPSSRRTGKKQQQQQQINLLLLGVSSFIERPMNGLID